MCILTPTKSSRRSSRAPTPSAEEGGTSINRSMSPKRPSQTSHYATGEPDRKAPRTPPRRRASGKATTSDDAGPAIDLRIVTPATALALEKKFDAAPAPKPNARRSLSMAAADKSTGDSAGSIATIPEAVPEDTKEDDVDVVAKKKLPFDGRTKSIKIPANVQRTYTIVRRHTGNIGGNGCGGAIYGELTTGSMQKMTNLMIEHTGLDKDSRFIDVGCGLGKPNLHVAQYPGVDFSYGIEMEQVRWMLGMANLYQVLEAAKKDVADGQEESEIGHSCYLAHGDITEANHFDPFTHVYMFDIGFPPRLFLQLAKMFNTSKSEYLICYHAPRLMVDRYGFNIELIVQTPTSMHGSAEGHQGYIYRRTGAKARGKVCRTKTFGVPCDPLFSKGWKTCRAGLDAVHKFSADEVEEHMGISKKRVTRSSTRARRNQLAQGKK